VIETRNYYSDRGWRVSERRANPVGFHLWYAYRTWWCKSNRGFTNYSVATGETVTEAIQAWASLNEERSAEALEGAAESASSSAWLARSESPAPSSAWLSARLAAESARSAEYINQRDDLISALRSLA
jgi:hypothetical protein